MTFGVKCISFRGQSHTSANLPCQDTSGYYCLKDSYVVCTVADGHGSLPHIRSDIGSKIATKISLSILSNILDDDTKIIKLKNNNKAYINSIKKEIVKKWIEEVDLHFRNNPLNLNEKEKVGDCPDPLMYYGTTLVAYALTTEFLFGIQIGDGGISGISNDGKLINNLVPADSRCKDNFTTSLCDKDAFDEIRHFLCTDKNLIAVAAYTDGIETACDSQSLKTYLCGFTSLLYDDENWYYPICENIETFTKINHRDDVSLAIAYRCDADFESLYKHTFGNDVDVRLNIHDVCPLQKITYDGKIEDSHVIEKAEWITKYGHKYDGRIINGEPIKFKDLSSGTEYSGNTKDFEKDGKGTETEPDGYRYVGTFRNGLRSGSGKIFRKDGELIFEGHFKNGFKEGEGVEYHDGKQYFSGEFKKGYRFGHGIVYGYDKGLNAYGTEQYFEKIIKEGHFEGLMFCDDEIEHALSCMKNAETLESAMNPQLIKQFGLEGSSLQAYKIIVEEASKLNLSELTESKFKKSVDRIKTKVGKTHIENSTAFTYYVLKQLCEYSGNTILFV